MDHLSSIIWLAIWPILIYTIYRITYWVMKTKGFLYEENEDQY